MTDDPHLDLAAYALDALTPEERTRFEAHLADCPDCQRQLREFSQTAAELSADTAATPPEHLRTDVLAAISSMPQLGPEPGGDESGRHEAAGAQPVSQPEPDQAEPAPQQVSPGQRPQRAARTTARRVGQIVLAAAVAVILAVGGWVVGRQQQVSNSVQAGQTAQSRLLQAPDARIYRQPMRNNASISYVVSKKRNAAMAIISGKPTAGSGHVFQLWTMHGPKGNQPKSAGTFSGTRSKPIWLTGNISSAAAVAITVEPDGGSPQPTTKPFAAQKL